MRILIVEDEPQILQGIRCLLEEHPAEFAHVDAVSSGEKALELIEACSPDLVLTDIILPEMTGLELMERVTERKLETHFMVISSYSDFRYAQMSVRLGALDYILKPFDPGDLMERVRTVTQSIAKERQEQRRQLDLATVGSEALKRNFVLGLCLQRTALQEHVMHNIRFWQLEWLTGGPLRVASLALRQNADKTLSLRERELQSFVLGNIAQEVIQTSEPLVLVQGAKHEWVIIASAEWDFTNWIGRVREAIRQYQRGKLCAGLSASSHSVEQLPVAFEQSQKALVLSQLEDECPIIDYAHLPAGPDNEVFTASEVFQRILDGEAEEVVDRFLELQKRSGEVFDCSDMSANAFEWLVNLQHEMPAIASAQLMKIWEQLDECASVPEIKSCLIRCFEQLVPALKTAKPQSNSFVERAVRIIQEKCGDKQLSLQSVADELEMHPVTLSKLFKRETGRNFHDYVTEARMERAKALLRESNLKIYEIGEMTGYSEMRYFTKIFKKTTGVTPKEYRYGK